MERHPNRESVIGLYLKDHRGTDKVRISENPSTLVIVFCIDDERGRLQHRLEVRHSDCPGECVTTSTSNLEAGSLHRPNLASRSRTSRG